jgi:hypothetical protein
MIIRWNPSVESAVSELRYDSHRCSRTSRHRLRLARLSIRIGLQVHLKCWHAILRIGHEAVSLTRTRTSHFMPSYSTSNVAGIEFDPHTNPTNCFARVSFESQVSKSSGFAGMAVRTSRRVSDRRRAKIRAGVTRRLCLGRRESIGRRMDLRTEASSRPRAPLRGQCPSRSES